MTKDRPPIAFLAFFAVALVGVLVFVGTMAFQGLRGDERERPATFVEQVAALPVVQEVDTESKRIAGSNRARSFESWITLSPKITEDPAGAAADLAGVTWGYDRSHWSIEGLASTAQVSYRGPVDEAPVRWWTEAVSALQDADAHAALHCRITDALLRCAVEGGDTGRARQALAQVDGAAVRPWLEAARPDAGEESGFSLLIGGDTVTDPASVR